MEVPTALKKLYTAASTPFQRYSVDGNEPVGVPKGFRPNWQYKTPFGVLRSMDVATVRRLGRTPYAQMITNTVADRIAGLEWEIVPKPGKNVSKSKLQDYENFLKDPNENPDQNWSYITKTLMTDSMELDAGVLNKWFTRGSYEGLITETQRRVMPGEVYNGVQVNQDHTIFIRGKLKPPRRRELAQLWVKDGATFTMNPDIYGVLPEQCAYYQFFYTLSNRVVSFSRDEIVYIKNNPRSYDLYGWSYLQAAQQLIDSLMQGISSYQKNFNSDEIPDGFIEAIGASKDDTKRIKEMITKRIIQPDNDLIQRRIWNKLIVVNNPMKFHPIKLTPRDMDLLAQQEWFLKVLLWCAGATMSEIGMIENANKASAFVDSRTFMRKCILPRANRMEYMINAGIMYEIDPDVMFQYRYQDLDDDIERDKLYSSRLDRGVVTINEVREELGKDPVSWGDEPFKSQSKIDGAINESIRRFIPSSKSITSLQGGPGRAGTLHPLEAASVKATAAAASNTKPLRVGQPKNVGEAQTNLSEVMVDLFKERETELLNLLDRELTNNVLTQIKSDVDVGVECKALSDLVGNLESLFKSMLSPISGALDDLMNETYNFGVVKANMDLQYPFSPNLEALKAVKSYTFQNIKDLTQQTSDSLRQTITRGLLQGLGVDELKQEIKKVFDVGETRAKAIAHTELNRAFNTGAVTTYEKSGLGGSVEWVAFLDDKTSPVCRALNGERVKLGDKFRYKGESFTAPPAHVNCRSTVSFIPEPGPERSPAEVKFVHHWLHSDSAPSVEVQRKILGRSRKHIYNIRDDIEAGKYKDLLKD